MLKVEKSAQLPFGMRFGFAGRKKKKEIPSPADSMTPKGSQCFYLILFLASSRLLDPRVPRTDGPTRPGYTSGQIGLVEAVRVDRKEFTGGVGSR